MAACCAARAESLPESLPGSLPPSLPGPRWGPPLVRSLGCGTSRAFPFTSASVVLMSLRLLTCLFTSKKLRRVKNRSRHAHLAGMGYANHSTLAGCGHPRRRRTLPERENLQGMTSCYTSGTQKAKGEVSARGGPASVKSKKEGYLFGLPFYFQRFELISQLSCE